MVSSRVHSGFNTLVPIQDRLIGALRRYGQSLPAGRQGRNTTYTMTDFVLAAFASFIQSPPSWRISAIWRRATAGRTAKRCLAWRKSIAAMNAAPSSIRRQSGGLDAMRCVDGDVLIALDGTEYHCSRQINYPNGSHRKRGEDKIEYFLHPARCQARGAGHNRAVPLVPKFIGPQDGHDKQDCESRAARRWLTAHGAHYCGLNPVYMGDDLISRQTSSGHSIRLRLTEPWACLSDL